MIANPLEELRRRAAAELSWMDSTRKALAAGNPLAISDAVNADVAGLLGHVVKDAPLRLVKTGFGELNRPGEAGTGEEKFQRVLGDDPMTNAVADIVLDPWSYVGFGLPGKALPLTRAIPNPAVRAGVEQALKFLDAGDRGVSTVSGQAMEAALGAPRVATKLIGRLPGAGAIGAAFDRSAHSVLAQRVSDLMDHIARVRASGLDLREAARDLAEARAAGATGARPSATVLPTQMRTPPVPGGIGPPVPQAVQPTAMGVLNDLLQATRQEIGALETPEARGAAALLKAQQDRLQEDAFSRAYGIQEQVRRDVGDNALSAATASTPDELAGYDRISRGFRDAAEQTRDTIESLRFTVQQLGEQFPLDPANPPDPARFVPIDRALASYERALTRWQPLISAAAPLERPALVMKRNQALHRAEARLRREMGDLPDELAGLVAKRFAQLGRISMGQGSFVADLGSKFEGDIDLTQRVVDAVTELAQSRRRAANPDNLPPGLDLYDVAVNDIREQLARELGLRRGDQALERIFGEAGRPVAAAVRNATSLGSGLWREWALAWPSFLLNNNLGGVLAGIPEGINPFKVQQQVAKNLGRAVRGEVVRSDLLDNLHTMTDIGIPDKLLTESGTQAEALAAEEFGRRGAQRASEVLGSKILGPAGAAVGGLAGYTQARVRGEPETEQAKQAAIGAGALGLYGAAFPKISRSIFGANAAIESGMRESAFVHRATERIQEALPALRAEVERTLGTRMQRVRPAAGGGRTLYNRTMPAAQRWQVLADLEAVLSRQGNLISPDAVTGTLINAGVDPNAALQVGKFWRDRLDEASSAGMDLVNKVHFDYTNLNNVEQFLRGVSPFSTWALKAYPYWARHLAQRPGMGMAVLELNEASDQYKKEHGLTDRFTGGLPIGAGDVLYSALLGRPVTPFFNVLRAGLPFADVSRGAASLDNPGEGILEAPLAAVESVLPGVNPVLKSALRTVGTLGTQAPQGVIPRGGAFEAITGINPNAPQEALERTVREKLGGQEVFDFRRSAIDKRIDELAVGETGHTTRENLQATVPYQRAKLEQEGPIYERARADVEREGRVRGIAGSVLGGLAPTALLPQEEGQIREARRTPGPGGGYYQMDQKAAATLRDAMLDPKNKMKRADPAVAAALRTTATDMFGGTVPPAIERHLQAGTNAHLDEVRKELYRIQVKRDPLIAAYGPQGGGEKAQLEGLLSRYYNPQLLLAEEPGFAQLAPAQRDRLVQALAAYDRAPKAQQERIAKANPTLRGILKVVKARRENLKAQEPELARYLAVEAGSKGESSIDQYLAGRVARLERR